MRRRKRVLHGIKYGIQGLLYGAVVAAFLLFAFRSLTPCPLSDAQRKEVSLRQLRALRQSMRDERGAQRMQAIFPEGACFTLTLYGLAWTNLARQFPEDPAIVGPARIEALWALEQLDEAPAASPFVDTQVRLGVFWLGQRNLLLGQLLAIEPEASRPGALVEEFHRNSQELAEAFLASPSRHLDSYPGMCWPADNVTALASLILHDDLYQSDYRAAYEAWKAWTLENPDPPTGLPAGHLKQQNGQLIEPARGCANSWNLSLLAQIDPPFAREQYALHREHFVFRRLGFLMVREYPPGRGRSADVDSGPIILGAGVTATGVGLAAARANGDEELASDIYKLSHMFGAPRTKRVDGEKAKEYLFGFFPTGDAFLAYGNSIPPIGATHARPKLSRAITSRLPFMALTLICGILLGIRGWFYARSVRRFMRET